MPSKNTKKKLKESAKSQQPAKVEEVVVEATENVEGAVQVQEPAVETQKQQTNAKAKKAKKVEKKPSRIKKKTKEVFSELKKVNWPTVKQVAKKTATVLAVVAIFAIVLLGIHKLLEVIYDWFITGLK